MESTKAHTHAVIESCTADRLLRWLVRDDLLAEFTKYGATANLGFVSDFVVIG